jgi:glycosyltransferase involved in cell wall biosynthesis
MEKSRRLLPSRAPFGIGNSEGPDSGISTCPRRFDGETPVKDRLNVLMLINALLGGAARSALEVVKGLDPNRFGFSIAALSHHQAEEQKHLSESFRSHGADIIHLQQDGALSLAVLPRLYSLLRHRRIDVLHTHLPLSGTLGRVGGRLAGIPVIVSTQHSLESMYSPKTRVADQLTFPLSNAVVCVSGAVRDSLHIGTRLSRHKLRVVHNGVDVSQVDTARRHVEAAKKRRELGIDLRAPLIVNVARLAPYKNHRCLVEAMRTVVDTKPEACLLIIGWGKLEAQLRKQVRRFGLDDHVKLLGHARTEEVLQILAISDVFALPSACEGFNLAILEAMAAGKPVVATGISGIAEAVVDGKTGLLVSPDDPRALAQALLALLEDQDRARELGKAGRARVVASFTAHRMAEAYGQLYRCLIEGKRNQRAATRNGWIR